MLESLVFMVDAAEMASLIGDVREHVLYMQELGVESLEVHLPEIGAKRLVANAQQVAVREIERSAPRSEVFNLGSDNKQQTSARPAGSRLSSLPSLAKRPTSASPIMKREVTETNRPEIAASERPLSEEAASEPVVGTSIMEIASVMPQPTETIEQIRAEIGPDCTRCKLSQLGRTQVVNSTGNFNAKLMFVGEAPGADEDEQGFPFVGRAGQLLTKIIESIGISREDVFIGNINRCRPPGNRAPEPDETAMCRPFLQREIAVVRPRVIVVLGATAAHNLLETKIPIGKLRGQFHDYLGTKVMPTFHPAYLLRDPHKKREVWEDMKMVRGYLDIT